MFDGVGGFVIGTMNSNPDYFQTLYSNQFEPSRKSQDAFEVGQFKMPDMEHINSDVSLIPDDKFKEMRDAGVNMIVGGFPCQDYSVARSLSGEKGIQGKKGVLFWEIIRATKVIKPDYLILENVDRLLKSPSSQRGRDFGIMLSTFNDLGYNVEWRVINAADYGMPQRRRRVFFFVTKNNSKFNKTLSTKSNEEVIFNSGLFARQFPIESTPNKKRVNKISLDSDILKMSESFSDTFWNSGIMRDGEVLTIDTLPIIENQVVLKDILQDEAEIDERYYLNQSQIEKFAILRKSKQILRTSKSGHQYLYSEGSMSPYDNENLPGRTMLTSEGTINRSTHLIFRNGRYRFITPIEAERLQGFPDDWTKYKLGSNKEKAVVSDRMRYFFMGNALVTGIVKRIADELIKIDSL